MSTLLADHPRLVMFAQNICLLIFLLLGLAILLIFIFSSWTGARVMLWQASRREAEEARRRGRFSADGRALPPTGRGICEGCLRVAEVVYHLPDGRRLCGRCYDPEADSDEQPSASPAAGPDELPGADPDEQPTRPERTSAP